MHMMLQIANIADIAVHKFFILDKKNVDFFAMAFGNSLQNKVDILTYIPKNISRKNLMLK